MRTRKIKFKAPSQRPSFRSTLYTIQAKLLADIKIIRLRWAEGYTDADIRQELQLGFREWKRRIRIMRSVPADDDLIKSFKRYSYEHDKTVAKMQQRLQELKSIHTRAMEEVSFLVKAGKKDKSGKIKQIKLSRPRDLHLAANVTKNMHEIDRDILEAESKFVLMKQRLGVIEMPVPESFDPFGDEDRPTITAPNLVRAWRLREERRAAAAQDVTDATIVKDKKKQVINGEDKAETKK
jgi:hypothetical protein